MSKWVSNSAAHHNHDVKIQILSQDDGQGFIFKMCGVLRCDKFSWIFFLIFTDYTTVCLVY